VDRNISLQLVLPSPKQLEAPAVPDHGIERSEKAQSVVDLVSGGYRVLALRPEPQQAVDLGMAKAGFGVLLRLPHLNRQVRHSIAQ
jgi:hypothetical protein